MTRTQLAGLLAMPIATTAAFWIADGAESAATSAVIFAAFLALVLVGRRYSGTLDVLSGAGDERTRALYLRASAVSANVLACVISAWWLVTLIQGEVNETLGVVGVIFGVTFIAAAAVRQRRG